MSIVARWTGTCPSCKWIFEAVSETEPERNPYPVGLRCPQCGDDFLFLKRQEREYDPKVALCDDAEFGMDP